MLHPVQSLCSIIAAFFSLEIALSRIINTESAGKERTRLSKAVVLAVRELALQTSAGAESHDLAAFIVLALAIIAETIDISVAAWEKRGYWVKADKFRMEWDWAGQYSQRLRGFVLAENWNQVAQTSSQIAQHLGKITIPPRHRLGRPWVGAWNELQKR